MRCVGHWSDAGKSIYRRWLLSHGRRSDSVSSSSENRCGRGGVAGLCGADSAESAARCGGYVAHDAPIRFPGFGITFLSDTANPDGARPCLTRRLLERVFDMVFVDGKLTEEPCPQANEGCCPECDGELEVEYGFCRYGLGSFDRCNKCLSVFNFCEDV